MPGECWGLRGGAGRAGIGVRGSPSHCQPWHCCSPCSHPSPGTSIPTTSISASSIHQPRLQTRGSNPPPSSLPLLGQHPTASQSRCAAVPSFCWGSFGSVAIQDLWLMPIPAFGGGGGHSSGPGSKAWLYGGAQPSLSWTALLFSMSTHTYDVF